MAEEPLPPLPDNYQEEGNARIYQAAALCGVSKDQLAMEWKADKVVVRVHGDNVYVVAETAVAVGDEPVQVEEEDDERLVFSEAAFIDENDSNSFDNDDDDDDELLNYSLDDDGDDDEEIFEDNDDEDEGLNVRQDVVPSDNSSNSISGGGGVDLALLARAINAAFDDKDGEEDSNGGGTGYAIASRYEIEVTTPGTGDEFTTPVMFQAYKGFDVLVQHRDPKSGSIKTIEGRLVEKNSEFVVLNIKGGTKKLKNQNVLCVKLPKAKKEKGVR